MDRNLFAPAGAKIERGLESPEQKMLWTFFAPNFLKKVLQMPFGCGIIIEHVSAYPGVAQLVARLTGGQEAASSSLVTRTTSSRTSYRSRRRFLFQSKRRLSFTPSLLLSAKGHARLACSLVNALTTARCRYQPFEGFRVVSRLSGEGGSFSLDQSLAGRGWSCQ